MQSCGNLLESYERGDLIIKVYPNTRCFLVQKQSFFQNFCHQSQACHNYGLQMRVHVSELLSHISPKTYVVGTQKNHLIEMALLRTHNRFFA